MHVVYYQDNFLKNMMKPADNILFASVNLPILDKVKATQEILSIDDNLSFWDEYRNTRMIPLMTKLGSTGIEGTSNYKTGEFMWVKHTPKTIINWFENVVFNWLGERSRIMALITKPNFSNNEHIDCNRNEINTRQHKFRIVLQGETSTLYFITKEGKVRPPNIDTAFLMDGGWPHGMNNFTNELKVTLALGAPWTGKDNYENDLTYHLYRQDYSMPDRLDIEKYFKK